MEALTEKMTIIECTSHNIEEESYVTEALIQIRTITKPNPWYGLSLIVGCVCYSIVFFEYYYYSIYIYKYISNMIYLKPPYTIL